MWTAQENAKQTQALEAQLGSDKKVLYKLYLDVMREVAERGSKLNTVASVNKLRKWAFASLLIASDEVVLAHDRFLNAEKIGDSMSIAAIADVILAMRRDAGENGTNLHLIDVLQTFIKSEDIDKMKPICDQWERDRDKASPLTRAPKQENAQASRK